MKTSLLVVTATIALLGAGLASAHIYLLDGLDGWLFSVLGENDTLYARGYSDAGFRQAHRGMPESELLKLLGTPLGEVWIYQRAAPPAQSSKMVSFHGEVVDRVDPLEGGSAIFFRGLAPGMSKRDVLKLIGEPLEKSFVYSKSAGDQSYSVRTIMLEKGVVVRKTAYFYLD